MMNMQMKNVLECAMPSPASVPEFMDVLGAYLEEKDQKPVESEIFSEEEEDKPKGMKGTNNVRTTGIRKYMKDLRQVLLEMQQDCNEKQ